MSASNSLLSFFRCSLKVNVQVLKVDRLLITIFKPFFRGKEIKRSEMRIFSHIINLRNRILVEVINGKAYYR